MDADERIRRYAERNVRERLGWPPIGTPEGTRNNHYESCPELQMEVVSAEDGSCWHDTCEQFIVTARVSCPHGEVRTSLGVVPLVPVTIELSEWGRLDELFTALDEV